MPKRENLILITAHYPHVGGEPFLDDELKVAERFFKKIIIINYDSKHGPIKGYIPSNAQIVDARKKRFEFVPLLDTAIMMLSSRAFREKKFACEILGYSGRKLEVNKKIFTCFYIANCLKRRMKKRRNKNDWGDPAETIFYSYWMSEGAYFLTEYKKKNRGALCICRTHGGDCYIDKNYDPFRREILTGLDKVFSISEAGKRSISELLLPYVSGAHTEIEVSRLGISAPEHCEKKKENKEAFSIVTCSNVIQVKRLDLIIDAIALIRNISINWIHFGDGDMRLSMQKKANEVLGNKNNINFSFAGITPKSSLMEYYRDNKIDLFINASDSEGIPVSIMEAFSYGIPAIARDVGGNSEVVRDGYNGLLLPGRISAARLADAIETIYAMSDDDRRKISENAYNTFKKDFSADINYDRFYRGICGCQEREQ